MSESSLQRFGRTFVCNDKSPELPPWKEFVRRIPLPERIPDDAEIVAVLGDNGRTVEILVPKYKATSVEKEVKLLLTTMRK